MMYQCALTIVLILIVGGHASDHTELQDNDNSIWEWDENGYVFFCLCMGKNIVSYDET